MKLYEFEGQRILARVGIEAPFFVVCESLDEIGQGRRRLKFPIVAKVQVLAGRRAKGGGIKIVNNMKQLLIFAKEHFGVEFLPVGPLREASGQVDGEVVRFITLAEKVEIAAEMYVSITYDTVKKLPFILFCEEGGIDVEEIKREDPEKIKRVDIDPFVGPSTKNLEMVFRGLARNSGSTPKEKELVDFVERLWDAFSRFDCRLVEINPLAYTSEGKLVAIDAKVILDDAGLSRHRDLDVLPKGAITAAPTHRELLAKQIDKEDYRGSAGSTFIELGGVLPAGESGIAILASGGGASLMLMDCLLAVGGRPANYTEYSGNPPAEKVEKLTKITLDRPNLCGCLVAGAVANFTDIYETLRGFVKGLRQVRPKPTYPIVIRRGGPRQVEAYKMLERVVKKEGFDIHLFGPETPISVACQKMVELSEQFKKSKIKDKRAYFK